MIHYIQGNVYRTETINVFDDIVLHNYILTGENRYNDNNAPNSLVILIGNEK